MLKLLLIRILRQTQDFLVDCQQQVNVLMSRFFD